MEDNDWRARCDQYEEELAQLREINELNDQELAILRDEQDKMADAEEVASLKLKLEQVGQECSKAKADAAERQRLILKFSDQERLLRETLKEAKAQLQASEQEVDDLQCSSRVKDQMQVDQEEQLEATVEGAVWLRMEVERLEVELNEADEELAKLKEEKEQLELDRLAMHQQQPQSAQTKQKNVRQNSQELNSTIHAKDGDSDKKDAIKQDVLLKRTQELQQALLKQQDELQQQLQQQLEAQKTAFEAEQQALKDTWEQEQRLLLQQQESQVEQQYRQKYKQQYKQLFEAEQNALSQQLEELRAQLSAEQLELQVQQQRLAKEVIKQEQLNSQLEEKMQNSADAGNDKSTGGESTEKADDSTFAFPRKKVWTRREDERSERERADTLLRNPLYRRMHEKAREEKLEMEKQEREEKEREIEKRERKKEEKRKEQERQERAERERADAQRKTEEREAKARQDKLKEQERQARIERERAETMVNERESKKRELAEKTKRDQERDARERQRESETRVEERAAEMRKEEEMKARVKEGQERSREQANNEAEAENSSQKGELRAPVSPTSIPGMSDPLSLEPLDHSTTSPHSPATPSYPWEAAARGEAECINDPVGDAGIDSTDTEEEEGDDEDNEDMPDITPAGRIASAGIVEEIRSGSPAESDELALLLIRQESRRLETQRKEKHAQVQKALRLQKAQEEDRASLKPVMISVACQTEKLSDEEGKHNLSIDTQQPTRTREGQVRYPLSKSPSPTFSPQVTRSRAHGPPPRPASFADAEAMNRPTSSRFDSDNPHRHPILPIPSPPPSVRPSPMSAPDRAQTLPTRVGSTPGLDAPPVVQSVEDFLASSTSASSPRRKIWSLGGNMRRKQRKPDAGAHKYTTSRRVFEDTTNPFDYSESEAGSTLKKKGEGFLMKLVVKKETLWSAKEALWKPQFFKIINDKLDNFIIQKSGHQRGMTRVGGISLPGTLIRLLDKDKDPEAHGVDFAFSISIPWLVKPYILRARSEEDRAIWIGMLLKHSSTWLSRSSAMEGYVDILTKGTRKVSKQQAKAADGASFPFMFPIPATSAACSSSSDPTPALAEDWFCRNCKSANNSEAGVCTKCKSARAVESELSEVNWKQRYVMLGANKIKAFHNVSLAHVSLRDDAGTEVVRALSLPENDSLLNMVPNGKATWTHAFAVVYRKAGRELAIVMVAKTSALKQQWLAAFSREIGEPEPGNETPELFVGTRCTVQTGCGDAVGTVRHSGNVHFSPGHWIGVELDEPLGHGNGSLAGKEFFRCSDDHAYFSRQEFVQPAR